jgi:pimeloyl-ACP methyl ester carboxylesterase
VAFKGTTPSSLEDWGANIAQGLGMESAYYNQAMEIARTASEMAPGAVHYVGHSLGGGMASAAAAAAKSTATTFNAAGVKAKTLERRGKDLKDAVVDAYYVAGDILSGIQDRLPLSEAVGKRLPLPPAPPSPTSAVKDAAMAAIAAAAAMIAGPVSALLGALGIDAAVEGVRKHGMDEVIKAIDQEADKIEQEMVKAGCI